MKKLLMICLLAFASCQSVTSVETAQRAPKDDKAYQLIEACMKKQGPSAVECRFSLAEEYATTYSAQPTIIDDKVLDSGSNWQRVQYTIQVEKLRYYIIVKEPKTDLLAIITTNSTFILVGIVLGYVIKVAKFAALFGL